MTYFLYLVQVGVKTAGVYRTSLPDETRLASAKMLVQVAAVVLVVLSVLLRTYNYRTQRRHEQPTNLTLMSEFRVSEMRFVMLLDRL